jgi:hypothetical protein
MGAAFLTILLLKVSTFVSHLTKKESIMPRKQAQLKAGIIYQGPSLIDGAPIVAIALFSKRNAKTGGVVQTYILRADIDPRKASKTGADISICGDCPMRGTPTKKRSAKQAAKRKCYVLLGQGPLIVWNAFKRGVYADASAARVELGRGRVVRVGTYGDGAAVPFHVWEQLTRESSGHTAYSHQATKPGAEFNQSFYMRSVESESEAREAWRAGQRTFRVVRNVADIVKGAEILCPASKEAGKRTTCADCKLCAGAAIAAKSIAIPAHGAGGRNFI